MKKRVLKPTVEKVLQIFTATQLVFFLCLEDFEWSALPFIVVVAILFIANVMILSRYSRNSLKPCRRL